MVEAERNVFCDRCRERLEDLPPDAPCPECGGTTRKILTPNGSVLVGGWISGPREVVRKHPVWTAIYALTAIGTVVGSLIALGPIASTVSAVLFFAIGHIASERWKVREREVEP